MNDWVLYNALVAVVKYGQVRKSYYGNQLRLGPLLVTRDGSGRRWLVLTTKLPKSIDRRAFPLPEEPGFRELLESKGV